MGIRLDGLVALLAGLNGLAFFGVTTAILGGVRLAAREPSPGLSIHLLFVPIGLGVSALGLAIDFFSGAKAMLDVAVPAALLGVVVLWGLGAWAQGAHRDAKVIAGLACAHGLFVTSFLAVT